MKKIIIALTSFPLTAFSLEPLNDSSMSDYTGQAGISISAEITINENGGPLDGTKGGRVAVSSGSTDNSNGWLIYDDVKGSLSYENLTLKTRYIGTGATDNDSFHGDENSFNRDVLEIGLPDTVKYENVSYTVATSAGAGIGSAQTELMTFTMSGEVEMAGNVLLFPHGSQ